MSRFDSKIRSILYAAFLFLWAFPAWSQVTYGNQELARGGISTNSFKILGFSRDNQKLFAIEKVNDIRRLAKGSAFYLRVMDVRLDLRISTINTYLLPVREIDGIAFSDDGRKVLISGDYGTRFLELNVPTRAIRTIFQRQKGQAGFRSQTILVYRKGQFISEGYRYDDQGYYLNTAVVKLDLAHANSPSLFQETWNVTQTEKKLGPRMREFLATATTAYLIPKPASKEYTLWYYNNGALTQVDKGPEFGGWAGTEDRLLYTVDRGDKDHKIRSVILKDFQSGKSWTLSESTALYTYPYLADEGRLAIVSLFDVIDKKPVISFFYAREHHGFTIKPIPELQKMPLGIFRPSDDGQFYIFQNQKGITLGRIP